MCLTVLEISILPSLWTKHLYGDLYLPLSLLKNAENKQNNLATCSRKYLLLEDKGFINSEPTNQLTYHEWHLTHQELLRDPLLTVTIHPKWSCHHLCPIPSNFHLARPSLNLFISSPVYFLIFSYFGTQLILSLSSCSKSNNLSFAWSKDFLVFFGESRVSSVRNLLQD